jgi:hypothetical protein
VYPPARVGLKAWERRITWVPYDAIYMKRFSNSERKSSGRTWVGRTDLVQGDKTHHSHGYFVYFFSSVLASGHILCPFSTD